MAPGVGKTYAMLEAAQAAKLEGRDVVVGAVELHGSRATKLLLKGLSTIPGRQINAQEPASTEMDVGAILARRPHLVVIDDLAHINAASSRRAQRHQDAREFIEAGIDVYATLNLQNIASQADSVQRIIGTMPRNLVPDALIEGAEMRLVDLNPSKSPRQLREHVVQLTQDAGIGRIKFLSESDFVALRTLAWRFMAERITREGYAHTQANKLGGPWRSGQRLMAVLRPGDDCERIVRRAAQLANASNSHWIAVYVEARQSIGPEEHSRLAAGLALATEMGAEVVATIDEDTIRGLLRVADQRNITQILIGSSRGSGLKSFQRNRWTRRLLRSCGEIDIHFVSTEEEPHKQKHEALRFPRAGIFQYALATGIVAIITIFAYLFSPRIGGPHAVALIYLLAVMVLGSFARRGPTLLAATMSAILWDYFVLPPTHELRINSPEDALLLGMYFVVALVVGQLSTRIRAQQEVEHLREERATALYLLTRELSEAATFDHIVERAVQQMERAFKARIIVFLFDAFGHPGQSVHRASTFEPSEDETAAAYWVFRNGRHAGKFTANIPRAEAHFVPLTTSAGVVGAVGLRLDQTSPPTVQQLNLFDGFAQQIAYALDRQRLREVSEEAKLLAESERLSKTLLNSMSHEIKTPIAVISSAVGYLAPSYAETKSEAEQSAFNAIQEATHRLNRLVGNVFDIARLESGHVRPRPSHCDVKELIHMALTQTERELSQHNVLVEVPPDLPMVRLDFVLMEQALSNLLSNAAVHTKAGTQVVISARVENDSLVIDVADRGPGIPPEHLGRVFEKFYRGPNAPTGGTGLGLSLVKGFVEAQNGRVSVKNRAGGGTIFTIRMPVGDLAPTPAEVET